MGLARKFIRIELICLIIDKSKNWYDPEYTNVLVDEFGLIPFAILKNEDFSLDRVIRSMYNEWMGIDFDWTTKYLADVSIKQDTVIIRYVVKIPKIENAILKGKIVTCNNFLNMTGDEDYDRVISG